MFGKTIFVMPLYYYSFDLEVTLKHLKFLCSSLRSTTPMNMIRTRISEVIMKVELLGMWNENGHEKYYSSNCGLLTGGFICTLSKGCNYVNEFLNIAKEL